MVNSVFEKGAHEEPWSVLVGVVSFHLPGGNQREGGFSPSSTSYRNSADVRGASGAGPQETRGHFRFRLRHGAQRGVGHFWSGRRHREGHLRSLGDLPRKRWQL